LADPTRLRQISERIPAGRWGDPKDFAGPVVFLASKASQYVCGELLVVDGVSLISSSYIYPSSIIDRMFQFSRTPIGLDGQVGGAAIEKIIMKEFQTGRITES
jgi:hypothetical protein